MLPHKYSYEIPSFRLPLKEKDYLLQRRTKDPKPIPKTFERPKPIENTSPSWMTEIKLRRGSRSSKVQQESSGAGPEIKEPDSPSWMKEVLTKKKRAADAMERRGTKV